MARIVSFVTYQSGNGKATTTFHIACGLAMFHDQRVLLIDSDPETGLTLRCSSFANWQTRSRAHGSLESLYRGVIKNAPISVHDVIWKRPLADERLKNI